MAAAASPPFTAPSDPDMTFSGRKIARLIRIETMMTGIA